MLRALAAALLVAAAASVARAQPLAPGESPTVGVAVPVGVIAGDGDATSVQLDPANLAFLRAWNAALVAVTPTPSGSGLVVPNRPIDPGGLRPGAGAALYLGAPIPYLEQLAVGADLQFVAPPTWCAGGFCFPYRDLVLFQLGLAWRPIPALAIGATYSHVFPGDTPGSDGIDTLDVAISGHLGAWFAAALVVHDLPGPRFQGLALQRVYEPELAVRPLGDDRWEMAIAARIGERRGDVDPRFRVTVQPIPGLLVKGALEWVPDVDLMRRLGSDGSLLYANDLRATLGLELNLSRVGAGAFARFGGSPSWGGRFDGVAVTARLSGERWPSLREPLRLERIDLKGEGARGTAHLLAHLRKAERDDRLDGIVLVVGELGGSWATMDELREAIARLVARKKHVFAYGAEFTTKSYYVATAAEKLWLDPSGGVRLVGMSSTAMYFKGTLDLLGVQADFVKIGEYKSAPEQYTRSGPSPEAREVKESLLDDTWNRAVAKMAAARRVDEAKMRALVDAGPFTAAEAKASGLVDGVRRDDEVEEAIAAIVGHPVEATPVDVKPRRPRSWEPPAIAVLFVEGDLVEGRSMTIPLLDMKLAGGQTLLESLVAARSDPRVKAIVLRIDSPGGNALVSDLIAREVARTRKVKPVVCSFGDVAASGGYFIAAPCETIVAAPSTITGSIGIFSGKVDVSGLAAKLGVTVDNYKRGAHADIESYWRPYTPDERALLLEKIRYYYDRFVDTVAEGRHMTHAEVDAIGRGHVWTGAQAKERKLVDRLGGFMDAVAEAKRLAGYSERAELELKAYPEEPTTLLGQLAQLLGVSVKAEPSPLTLLPSVAKTLRALPGSLLLQPSAVQARMEFTWSD